MTRNPDTLTKCLKVRWAECRQLFRSPVVAEAFCYGCECCLSNVAMMMGMSDYHLKGESCMAAANCYFGSACERLR